MAKDYRRLQAREMLNSYLVWKGDIENIQLEIEAIENDYDIQAMTFSERTCETFKINRELENRIISKPDKIKQLKQLKKLYEINCKKIENAFNSLKSEFERNVIELRYMKVPVGTWYIISKQLGFSMVACQKAEERAIVNMIPLLIK